mmetsp:Transcript_13565/g.38837  ORF Transcript_13565/g.38837 Transcript_13565/m.38837 type:complete len:608 (-) Transcript_13565:415-2238(-)
MPSCCVVCGKRAQYRLFNMYCNKTHWREDFAAGNNQHLDPAVVKLPSNRKKCPHKDPDGKECTKVAQSMYKGMCKDHACREDLSATLQTAEGNVHAIMVMTKWWGNPLATRDQKEEVRKVIAMVVKTTSGNASSAVVHYHRQLVENSKSSNASEEEKKQGTESLMVLASIVEKNAEKKNKKRAKLNAVAVQAITQANLVSSGGSEIDQVLNPVAGYPRIRGTSTFPNTSSGEQQTILRQYSHLSFNSKSGDDDEDDEGVELETTAFDQAPSFHRSLKKWLDASNAARLTPGATVTARPPAIVHLVTGLSPHEMRRAHGKPENSVTIIANDPHPDSESRKKARPGSFVRTWGTSGGFLDAAIHQENHTGADGRPRRFLSQRRNSVAFLVGSKHPQFRTFHQHWINSTLCKYQELWVKSKEDIDVGPEVPGVALVLIVWPKGSGPPEFKVVYDNTAISNPTLINKDFVTKFYADMKAIRQKEGVSKATNAGNRAVSSAASSSTAQLKKPVSVASPAVDCISIYDSDEEDQHVQMALKASMQDAAPTNAIVSSGAGAGSGGFKLSSSDGSVAPVPGRKKKGGPGIKRRTIYDSSPVKKRKKQATISSYFK